MSIPGDDFRTLYAIQNYLDTHSVAIKVQFKNKKKLMIFLHNLLDLLLKDRYVRQMFIDSGGNVTFRVTDCGEIVGIDEVKEVKE